VRSCIDELDDTTSVNDKKLSQQHLVPATISLLTNIQNLPVMPSADENSVPVSEHGPQVGKNGFMHKTWPLINGTNGTNGSHATNGNQVPLVGRLDTLNGGNQVPPRRTDTFSAHTSLPGGPQAKAQAKVRTYTDDPDRQRFPRISKPVELMCSDYDVVVIGSGYGGGVAASRMARGTDEDGNRQSVCLLELGKEKWRRFTQKLSHGID
jgi:hypothetical protein